MDTKDGLVGSDGQQQLNGDGGPLRSNLSLDLASGGKKRSRAQLGYAHAGNLWTPGSALLDSPDVKMLKLNTPEIERMISGVGMTPTPSLAPSNSVLPIYGSNAGTVSVSSVNGSGAGGSVALKEGDDELLSVTAEQMEYAKGFDIALQNVRNRDNRTDLNQRQQHQQMSQQLDQQQQQQQQQPTLEHGLGQATSNFVVPVTVDTVSHQHYEGQKAEYTNHRTSNSGYCLTQLQATTAADHEQQMASSGYPEANLPAYGAVQIKSEPDDQLTCGNNGHLLLQPGSPDMSPINMDDQERIKLERKRLRNRIAATKCRRNKLEKISLLEEKVKVLRTENSDLKIAVNRSRDYVSHLKQVIMEHMNHGCHIGNDNGFI